MIDIAPMELYWDSDYAIATALLESYPEIDPNAIGLIEIADLVETLPGFADDPTQVTERILLDIQLTWFEEKNP